MGKEATDKEVIQNYDKFWKEIIEPNGVLDMIQLKKELFDFSTVMKEVSKVYYEISNGKFSKPNTASEYILQEFNDRLDEAREEEYWVNFPAFSLSE